MWTLYDSLIAEIPANEKIDAVYQTERWLMVESKDSLGTAMKFLHEPMENVAQYKGLSLQYAAELIKSWDFQKAALGLAAINSFFNRETTLQQYLQVNILKNQDALADIPQLISTKKVGMVGHFPYIDKHPDLKEKVTVFELNPRPGDYPASASEFLLPEMDTVFITASTLINKTFPRLLELATHAEVILLGSSCPLTPIMLEANRCSKIGGTIYPMNIQTLLQNYKQTGQPLSKNGQQLIMMPKGE